MSRGQKDFGAYQQKAALSTMADVGELASRLNCPSRFDRLGDVIFLEDFGNDLGSWDVSGSGTGRGVEVATERKFTGAFSCKMTGGSDDDRYANIITRMPVPFSVVYGFEAAIALDKDCDWVHFLTNIYTGTRELKAGVLFDIDLKQNYYLDYLGNWVAIGALIDHYISSHNFIIFKFTLDIANEKYSRFIVPPFSYAIADIPFQAGGLVDNPRTQFEVRVTSDTGENAVCYLDSVIITANDI